MSKRVIGWILLAGVLAAVTYFTVGFILLGVQRGRFGPERSALNHLDWAISHFVGINGKFPDNWEDLVSSGMASWIDGSDDDLLVYSSPPDEEKRSGRHIKKIDRYKIAFGLTYKDITFKGEQVFDKQGNAVIFIRQPDDSAVPKPYYDAVNRGLALILRYHQAKNLKP